MSHHLQSDPKIMFYVTNKDRRFSAGKNKGVDGDSRYMVDVGAILQMLETASQRNAIAVGKPGTMAFDVIVRDHFPTKTPEEIKELLPQFLMVGDNLETDIQFANSVSIDSCLVFTGV